MLIADISLLGVRLPRHRYHHRSAALKSLRAGATGVTGRGRTKRTLVWSVGKKAKGENYGESWSLFLSQGSKCTHILQQSPSVSCPSSQVFRPDNVEQPPAFFFSFLFLETALPFDPFVHRSELFPLLFHFCFLLALTSNHLTRNEWMNAWKWLCVMLKLGNVFLQHVNIFFFPHTLIVNWFLFCFFVFSFTRLQKQNKTN